MASTTTTSIIAALEDAGVLGPGGRGSSSAASHGELLLRQRTRGTVRNLICQAGDACAAWAHCYNVK